MRRAADRAWVPAGQAADRGPGSSPISSQEGKCELTPLWTWSPGRHLVFHLTSIYLPTLFRVTLDGFSWGYDQQWGPSRGCTERREAPST